MNVIFWAGGSSIGGVNTWVSTYKKHLSDGPHAPIIMGDTATFSGGEKVDIVVSSWAEAEDALAKAAPAVVIPNYRFQLFGVCAKLNKKGVNIRCLGMCHSDNEEDYYKPLKWYGSAAAKFIAIGQVCRDNLVKQIPHRKDDIFCVPCGIEIPPQRKNNYSLNPVKIVYFGRLSQKQKRIFDLADLAGILLKKKVPFSFDIIGNGPESSKLSRMLYTKGLSGAVRVLPQIPHSKILSVLGDYDIFVQASDYEGMGLSMVESMAAGVIPVVTKASGGAWDIIRHGMNGFCAEIGHIDKMADAVESISSMGQAEAQRIGNEARISVKNYCDIERTCPNFLKIIDLCAKSGPIEWEHGKRYFQKGPGSNYLPENRVLGYLLRMAFSAIPRDRASAMAGLSKHR